MTGRMRIFARPAAALALAAAMLPAPLLAGQGQVAAPVVRKAPPPPAPAGTGKSEQDYYAALARSAGTPGDDALLDQGLMRAMSRLIAAGRCADAAALATRSDRDSLGTAAQQLCQKR
jgi:hypothetical protein